MIFLKTPEAVVLLFSLPVTELGGQTMLKHKTLEDTLRHSCLSPQCGRGELCFQSQFLSELEQNTAMYH